MSVWVCSRFLLARVEQLVDVDKAEKMESGESDVPVGGRAALGLLRRGIWMFVELLLFSNASINSQDF